MSDQLLSLTNLLIALVSVLDSMPAYIRALLAGLILAGVLQFFERRVREDEIQFCQSFRKACLCALLIVPVVVALLPSSRMAVFVEEVPARNAQLFWLWSGFGLIWLIGSCAALTALARSYLTLAGALRSSPPLSERDKIHSRLPHWCNRLGLRRPIQLRTLSSSVPAKLPFSRQLGYPVHALHWPDSVQDILLIRELCHHKQRSGVWHLLAGVVSCCYWPVTWLPKMHQRLIASLQITTDSLAESCYGDRMSYARGLRQLDQRMAAPVTPNRSRLTVTQATTRLEKFKQQLQDYRSELKTLRSFDAVVQLDFPELFSRRENRDQHINAEPYDKVFWFIGQAVIVAMLISGPTLKPLPPDIDDRSFLPFEFVWMENFHRNQERVEQALPPIEPPVPAQ